MEVLDDDVLGMIISHLNIEDLLNLNCVDKKFNNITSNYIIKNTRQEIGTTIITWQYKDTTIYRIIETNSIFKSVNILRTKNINYYGYQYRYIYYGDKLSTYYRFIDEGKLLVHYIYTGLIMGNVYIVKLSNNTIYEAKCDTIINAINNIDNIDNVNYDEYNDDDDIYILFDYNYMNELLKQYKV